MRTVAVKRGGLRSGAYGVFIRLYIYVCVCKRRSRSRDKRMRDPRRARRTPTPALHRALTHTHTYTHTRSAGIWARPSSPRRRARATTTGGATNARSRLEGVRAGGHACGGADGESALSRRRRRTPLSWWASRSSSVAERTMAEWARLTRPPKTFVETVPASASVRLFRPSGWPAALSRTPPAHAREYVNRLRPWCYTAAAAAAVVTLRSHSLIDFFFFLIHCYRRAHCRQRPSNRGPRDPFSIPLAHFIVVTKYTTSAVTVLARVTDRHRCRRTRAGDDHHRCRMNGIAADALDRNAKR